ncbi:MAG: hypothetical protein JST92_19390, partial [Deltaproteobacteria bacterium]|nr:hypothetical protein [Deltaproteobacteria bacterium]
MPMQTRAAILAATCLTVLATAASATPTGTVHISIAQGGQPAGQVLVGEANPVPVVTVQYSLTNMNGASAHIEVDLCSPANTESYYITNSLYTTALGTCQDGFGLGGKTVHSGSITVTGTSQGATGTFTFQAPAADIITPDGTPWTLPARIVVEDASNTVIATDTTTTITHAHTNPGAYKYFVSAADANDPQTNTQPGHNVTWYISATNYYWGGGGLAFQGTTTATDPVPPGAVYVEGHQAGTAGTGFPNYPALNAAQLNSNFHITAPGAGVTSVQYSLDNLISTGAYEDGSAAYVTYWYPSSFTEADNTITAHFPSGPDQTASAVHYFPQGLGHLYMAKRHFCERGRSPNSSIFDDYNGWTTATAHKPNPHDNEQCAWAPEDTVRYQIIAYAFDDAYQNTSLAGTDFFDPIPAETTLVALPLLPGGVGWTMDYSTNASCSPLAPLDSSVPLNTVRCI